MKRPLEEKDEAATQCSCGIKRLSLGLTLEHCLL